MENIICKNCGTSFLGKFCPNCGQKANTQRLGWSYLKDEFNYTFLHVNKGLFFSIKELIIRPGDTIREFIEGKRVNHYKPLLLVFVLAGISVLLSSLYNIDAIFKGLGYKGQQLLMQKKINSFTLKNYAILEMILIPYLSFFSWITFKKYGYNYIENIIINAFIGAQRLLFSILLFPITYFLPYKLFMISFFLTLGVTFGLFLRNFLVIYKDREPIHVIKRLFIFFFISGSSIFLISIIITIFYFINNPEIAKSFVTK